MSRPKKGVRRPKKPPFTGEHAAVVRTHDGGQTWEMACPCGLRLPECVDKQHAKEEAKAHCETFRVMG